MSWLKLLFSGLALKYLDRSNFRSAILFLNLSDFYRKYKVNWFCEVTSSLAFTTISYKLEALAFFRISTRIPSYVRLHGDLATFSRFCAYKILKFFILKSYIIKIYKELFRKVLKMQVTELLANNKSPPQNPATWAAKTPPNVGKPTKINGWTPIRLSGRLKFRKQASNGTDQEHNNNKTPGGGNEGRTKRFSRKSIFPGCTHQFHEYCQHTSLHGFRYVTEKRALSERWVWASILKLLCTPDINQVINSFQMLICLDSNNHQMIYMNMLSPKGSSGCVGASLESVQRDIWWAKSGKDGKQILF